MIIFLITFLLIKIKTNQMIIQIRQLIRAIKATKINQVIQLPLISQVKILPRTNQRFQVP